MADQQNHVTIEIDSIVINPPASTTGEVDVDDLPEEILEITRGLMRRQPPSNPLIILRAACWWHIHGRGGADPAFRWAIEWTRHLTTDEPPYVQRYDAFLDRLVEAEFANDRRALRSALD